MPPEIRALFEQIGQTFNSLTDPNDPNYLGEPWRSQLLEIKGQINSSLKNLPATDQVPAAQEARWGLEALKSNLFCVQNIITSLSNIAKKSQEQAATTLASISGEVQKAIDAKIKAGELFTKESVTDQVTNARNDGEKTGFQKGRLLADRRTALTLAGIPPEVAAGAPDTVLLADEAVFNTHRDAAKERVTKLTGVGLSLNSLPVKNLPWAPKEEFDAQHSAFDEIWKAGGAGKGKTLNSKEAPKGNPLINNNNNGGETEQSQPMILC